MTNLPTAALARGLTETPDKIAFALLGPARAERWSYARLATAVRAVTGHLQAQALPDGPIGLSLGQSSDAIVTMLALLAAGHVPLVLGQDDAPPACVIGRDIPATTLRAWIDDTAAPEPAPRAPATTIIFAGQAHEVANIQTRAQAQIAAAGLEASDRVMWSGDVTLPMTFTLGLIATLQAGATLLLPAQGLPTATLALLMKRHDATVFAASPHHLNLVLAQNIGTLPRLRHGVSFGAALPATTAALWTAKTATPLRDLGPQPTPADHVAFALAAAHPAVTDIAAHEGTVHYAAAMTPEQLVCAIPTGGASGAALCQHHGPLPRDAEGCLIHPLPSSEQDQ